MSPIKSKSKINWFTLLIFTVGFVSFTGCYQRTLAPEVEYTNQGVEALRQQIDEMEWE